jgi:hypothetical protein
MGATAGCTTARLTKSVACLAATLALAAAAFAASAHAATYSVVGTGGTLHVRSTASLTAPIVGNLTDGTSINIVCQTRGPQVAGSTMWDKIDKPVAGYVSDWFTTTPVVNAPSPGLPPCTTPAPVCPSGLVGVPPNCTPPFDLPCPSGLVGTPPNCHPPVAPDFATIAMRYNGQRAVPAAVRQRFKTGPYWSGYCEAFVGLITSWPGGRGYGSAYGDYLAHLRRGQIHHGVPPRNAVVYWNPGNNRVGHVGVSLGNGQVISTYGYVGWREPIQVHGYRYFPNYLGWATA